MFGVAFGVLQRDLGAIGRAVQHELFIAQGLADRLDVLHRFLAGERAAGGPELQGALFAELADRVGAHFGGQRAAERPAVQGVRAAGAALVVDDQVAGPQRGGDGLGDEARQWVGRLAGSAGEREHGALTGAHRPARLEALHGE